MESRAFAGQLGPKRCYRGISVHRLSRGGKDSANMPELPEVETVCRGLSPLMVGQRFLAVDQSRAGLRFPFGRGFKTKLIGSEVRSLRRRAKYLIADLSTAQCLVMHLGMSGRFHVRSDRVADAETLGDYIYETDAKPQHDHVVFQMSGGHRITYNDPRRFGFMKVVPEHKLENHALFCHLGVEPLGNELSAIYLAGKATGRKSNLKAFLMDQKIVAGLGNIYVCEALHHARLSPNRSAGCLADRHGRPTARAERLVVAIRDVLAEAVRVGGSTLRDYRDPTGARGGFQEAFSVYDREGLSCVRRGCPGTVRRITQQGRSTFYCSTCQR